MLIPVFCVADSGLYFTRHITAITRFKNKKWDGMERAMGGGGTQRERVLILKAKKKKSEGEKGQS